MKRSIYLLCILFISISCSSTKHATSNQRIQLKDIAYASHERNIMDISIPAHSTKHTPFVILIHGGAWTNGSKENIQDFMDTLIQHNIAVASINHRYADHQHIHLPEMLADVDSAVLYCMRKSKEWNVRNNGFVLAGGSSGAHLATMYSYSTNKHIQAIVDFCGPMDFTHTDILTYIEQAGLKDVFTKMAGKDYNLKDPVDSTFIAVSPISHIKNIPMILFHGTADPVVPYNQAIAMDKALAAKKVDHKLISLFAAAHDLNLNVPETRKMIYSEVVKWITKYGK